MGLFDGNKKTCDLCGEKMGLLGGIFTSEDLADGKTICGSCRGKCTPGELRFSAMTLDDVKANIAVAAANKKKGAAEFKATQKIKKGAYRGDDFVDIDANHGWFMNAEEKDGWVYSLDDVYYFNLDLDYAPLEEGQGFEVRTEDYPELPRKALIIGSNRTDYSPEAAQAASGEAQYSETKRGRSDQQLSAGRPNPIRERKR